jgi:hypothetical protein
MLSPPKPPLPPPPSLPKGKEIEATQMELGMPSVILYRIDYMVNTIVFHIGQMTTKEELDHEINRGTKVTIR